MNDNRRQQELNEGWRAELRKQNGLPPSDPQEDDGCAPKAAQIILIFLIAAQQVYLFFTA